MTDITAYYPLMIFGAVVIIAVAYLCGRAFVKGKYDQTKHEYNTTLHKEQSDEDEE